MDFEMKEVFGYIVAVVVCAIVFATFLKFGLFEGIKYMIEGVL